MSAAENHKVLYSQTHSRLLIPHLHVASSFWSRAKGLLGTNMLPDNEALWIHDCRSIHTFFMNYAIDCAFLDRNLRVCKVVSCIRPYRMVGPFWAADSVIEFSSGNLERLQLAVGEVLHVAS